MRILVTRPEPEASAFAEELKALGHEPIVHPLLAFEPLAIEAGALDGAAGVIITSANAFRALAAIRELDRLLSLPLYCVGEETARKARKLGFLRIAAVAETASALASEIEAKAAGALVHLAGRHKAFDLEEALSTSSLAIRVVDVYEMKACPSFDAGLIEQFESGRIDGVILMSARTAEVFVHLCDTHAIRPRAANLDYFCISPAVAARIVPFTPLNRIKIARTPSRQALLDLLAEETAGPASPLDKLKKTGHYQLTES